jgi:uncharacterized protein
MIIDLSALDGRSKRVEIEIATARIDLAGEIARVIDPVRLNCQISGGGFQAEVEGRIETKLEVECTRCLEPVEMPLEFDFDVEFVKAEHFGVEGEHEIDPKNLSADSLGSERIDLEKLVREQILLNLPEKIFCRDDCKGLCENCGTNRNVQDCNCKKEEIDPRWSALKNLK